MFGILIQQVMEDWSLDEVSAWLETKNLGVLVSKFKGMSYKSQSNANALTTFCIITVSMIILITFFRHFILLQYEHKYDTTAVDFCFVFVIVCHL